ncbi:hypothetical protein MWU52_05300 [Jannaschia sp. S6380]|uniref:hypothetical protein n=1 Tax=Jannaschia sp. S6380 TaxID=2926408 RepID=UPI001FF23650|nr:hypothetical protein [Jannaschia sp. S6380]MCK0166962.1 hypothetical protein [Jannaschia sp. S6380]
MRSQTYLYRQGRHYHFRRRVPGLSTSIRPVRIALGTTDEKTAHTWSRTLITEFEAMLDAFLFVIDPLPEELIAHYFDARLKQALDTLRRQSRMERMSERKATLAMAVPIQRVVLTSLLTDGLGDALPPSHLDATWSSHEVKAAVDLYAREVAVLRDSGSRKAILGEFEALTRLKPRSSEHEYQVIEAHLHARLAALGAEHEGQSIRAKVFEDRAKELTSSQGLFHPVETRHPEPHPMVVTHPPVQNASPPPLDTLAVPGTEDEETASAFQPSPPLTEGVAEIEGPITVEKLRVQLTQAEHIAKEGAPRPDGADISSVFWRMALVDGFTNQTIDQRVTGVRLFCLVTGLQRVDQIRQHHLSSFRDALAEFPSNFLRSEHDAKKTFEEIRYEARHSSKPTKALSGTTRKRHTKTIELLLERAESEGHQVDQNLSIKKIKPKLKGAGKKHNRRPAFRFPELQKVFDHTLWQGAKSKGRRHFPGDVITKDCRYWIPLVLAYTGARRAEIAGLLASDIQKRDGHDCIVIQANEYRGIKGEEPGETDPTKKKTRVVPVHPHLIELGFLEFSEKQKRGRSPLLFPDVVPKPRKDSKRALAPDPAMMVEKFGESIDDMWRNSLEKTLDGNPRGLVMHSLRHYVNNAFLFDKHLKAPVRLDLVGHVDDEKENTNRDVYRDESPMQLKVEAINLLPRIF